MLEQSPRVLAAKTDASALGELYEAFYPRVLRFCVLRLYIQDLAEEVVSMVFLDVADSIGRFRGSSEPEFTAWLFRIATNHCHNVVRKKVRRQRILDQVKAEMAEPITTEPSKHGVLMDRWPKVYEAMTRLKPLEQTVITLRFFEKLEFDQIAKIIKRRPATVRVFLHRGLKTLRSLLTDSFSEGNS